MTKRTFQFSGNKVTYYFAAGLSQLKQLSPPANTIILTDENLYAAHTRLFRHWNTIVLKAGEAYKIQATVDTVIDQLIAFGADRQTTLVGIGGGVITDLTGYVASIYMRGIRFGFVPASLLAMVDASIGGKNGIDVGLYKNMVGVIRQPAFILHDMQLLNSLPAEEWQNGFAEIIKHACIKDAAMFRTLEKQTLAYYKRRKKAICELVQQNALLKTKVVLNDEFETGARKLLNFGHTLGHALENQYELSHGQAVSIGMTYACQLSEQLCGFKDRDRVVQLLERYQLPTYAEFDSDKAFDVLQKDKKKTSTEMNYILLEKLGKGIIRPIPMARLKKLLSSL